MGAPLSVCDAWFYLVSAVVVDTCANKVTLCQYSLLHALARVFLFSPPGSAGPVTCVFGCCFLFIIFYYIFRPIISTSTGPIFAILAESIEIRL